MPHSIYSIQLVDIKNEAYLLSRYEGQVILVVNTASRCGFTKQYQQLEKLYQAYKDQGMVILGFPCNQFNNQEPGSEDEIAEFCQLNFGVSFPLHQKIDVNGANTHPLYRELKHRAKGLLGSQRIKWNFTKFLISRDGSQIKRFKPQEIGPNLEHSIQDFL